MLYYSKIFCVNEVSKTYGWGWPIEEGERTGEITKSLLQAQMVQQTACVGCTLLSHLMPGFVAAIMCPGLHNKRGYIRIRNNLLNDVAGVNTISFHPCELMSQYQVAQDLHHVHRLSLVSLNPCYELTYNNSPLIGICWPELGWFQRGHSNKWHVREMCL